MFNKDYFSQIWPLNGCMQAVASWLGVVAVVVLLLLCTQHCTHVSTSSSDGMLIHPADACSTTAATPKHSNSRPENFILAGSQVLVTLFTDSDQHTVASASLEW